MQENVKMKHFVSESDCLIQWVITKYLFPPYFQTVELVCEAQVAQITDL